MASSLLDMCTRSCTHNIDGITSIGDLSYALARPFLIRIKKAEQLELIEYDSPHIREDSAEIWRKFIKKDFPKADIEASVPKNPANWSKVYRKLKKEDELRILAAEDALRNAFKVSKAEKEAKQANIIVDTVIPDLNKPRTSQKNLIYVDDQPNRWMKEGESRAEGRQGMHKTLAHGPQALKNARTGADKLAVLKRQAQHGHQNRNVTKSVPTHELQDKQSKILTAPKSMLYQYQPRIAPRPLYTPPLRHQVMFAPSHTLSSVRQRTAILHKQGIDNALTAKGMDDAQKEARLRALTQPSKSSPNKPAASSSAPTRPTASSPSNAKHVPAVTLSTHSATATQAKKVLVKPRNAFAEMSSRPSTPSSAKKASAVNSPAIRALATSAKPAPPDASSPSGMPPTERASPQRRVSISPPAKPSAAPLVRKRPAPSLFIQKQPKRVKH